MKAAYGLSLAIAFAWALPAQAGHLPDVAAAAAALAAAPEVAEARGALDAQVLRSEGLAHGRDEWTIGAEAGRRKITVAPRDTQAEWGMTLSRPLRLPARARADRALADALEARADANLGEALHESGRQLLARWFAWLEEAAQVEIWKGQRALAEQQLAAVDARIRLGEAARAERVTAEAALAQVRLQQTQAAARELEAQSRLLAHYPDLPVRASGPLPEPVSPGMAVDEYVAAVLEHSHELSRARRQAEALRAEAQQLASLRSADPQVGVFYKNEAGGDEHVLGVNVALTLPGAARRTDQQAAVRAAATAQEAVVRIERRLRQEARADFEAARVHVESWRQASRAEQLQAEAARLSALAYRLGEGRLDQVMVDRRLLLEAQLVARRAQLGALAADARMKLDTHRLWPLDSGADSHHGGP